MKSLLQQIIVYDNQKLEPTPVSVIERLALTSFKFLMKKSLKHDQIRSNLLFYAGMYC